MNLPVEAPASWTHEQRDRLATLQSDPNAWVGFWVSDKDGNPCWGGTSPAPAFPGKFESLDGEGVLCKTGFHATRDPKCFLREDDHRVWIVALIGKVTGTDTKSVGTVREIIGETDKVVREAISQEELETFLNLVTEDIDYNIAFKIAMNSNRMDPDQVELVLRKVAPLLVAHFQVNNSSLDGINPWIVKLSKHLQWRLALAFKAGWKNEK